MKSIIKKVIAQPGEKHKVEDFDPAFTGNISKEEAHIRLTENVRKLAKLQNKLYAEDRHALLLIFQGMDGAGKDGTIKHVMSGVNPQGCQVFSFKQPSAEELDHDFLWRIHKGVPERGRIGIFNRSHYEDVLVTKVHPEVLLKTKLPNVRTKEDITRKFWKQRYGQINDFKRYLTETGVTVLKFFLNVSKEEQEKRFISHLEDESKNWKFSSSDFEERQYWDEYMKAYSDMLTYTSTDFAPWYVIPADNKWFMRYVVGEIVCDKVTKLKPQYPAVTESTRQEIEKYRSMLTGNNVKEGEESASLQEQMEYTEASPV